MNLAYYTKRIVGVSKSDDKFKTKIIFIPTVDTIPDQGIDTIV